MPMLLWSTISPKWTNKIWRLLKIHTIIKIQENLLFSIFTNILLWFRCEGLIHIASDQLFLSEHCTEVFAHSLIFSIKWIFFHVNTLILARFIEKKLYRTVAVNTKQKKISTANMPTCSSYKHKKTATGYFRNWFVVVLNWILFC